MGGDDQTQDPPLNKNEISHSTQKRDIPHGLIPGPCAICIIPKNNTAAARVTKLQPTAAIQEGPTNGPVTGRVGETVFRHDQGREGGRKNFNRGGVGGGLGQTEGNNTKIRLREKI